jgi:hypothetical protein
MDELRFEVEIDEDGNYCASAAVPDGSLHTDALDLNSLLAMVRDVVALYAEELGGETPAFSVHFPPGLAA